MHISYSNLSGSIYEESTKYQRCKYVECSILLSTNKNFAIYVVFPKLFFQRYLLTLKHNAYPVRCDLYIY